MLSVAPKLESRLLSLFHKDVVRGIGMMKQSASLPVADAIQASLRVGTI
jgi:hypothetical protein